MADTGGVGGGHVAVTWQRGVQSSVNNKTLLLCSREEMWSLEGQGEGLKLGRALRPAEKGTQAGWVVAHTSKPGTLKVEVGRSRVRCHPHLYNEFKASLN